MSTFATPEMIVDHLEGLFGKNLHFTEDIYSPEDERTDA